MSVVDFVKRTVERAVKTAAQTVLLAVGASTGLDLFTADWKTIGGAAAGGFILSVITSVASAPFGDVGTPSLVRSSWTSITANGEVESNG